MARRRRNNAENAETRNTLIDTAVEILGDEGYGAVSCRRVAKKAGLSHQIVHYYFCSMEDLFFEIIKRASEKRIESLTRALVSSQPLWGLWDLITEKSGAKLEMEYLAIANHYPRISQEQAEYRRRFRRLQIEALSGLFEKYGVDSNFCSPATAAVIINSIARMMALEDSHAVTVGHQETQEFVEHIITELVGPRKTKKHPKGVAA